MHFRHARLAALVAVTCGASPLAQATVPASIPAGLEGTYNLIYDEINPSPAPLSDGLALTVVIQPGGVLCVPSQGLSLAEPFLIAAGTAEANWVTGDGLLIGLSNTITGAFSEFNIGRFENGSPTAFFGQFTGSRISNSTSCNGSDPDPAPEPEVEVTADMQAIVDLAAELYPEWFTNGDPFRLWNGYVYTYFQSSGVIAGFSEGSLFLLGGPFGPAFIDDKVNVNGIVNQGPITDVRAVLEEQKIRLTEDGIDVGENPDMAGDWTLVVSGNVTTMGFTLAFGGFTVENIAAPSSDDVDEMEGLVRESFADMEVGTLNSLTVTRGVFSGSRITFSVTFNTTISGVTSNYDLDYEYTR